MKKEDPKRIAIIGLPGSGKSTFATALGKALNIPVHHIDKHLFDGGKKRNQKEFLLIKGALLKEERWIIEGCSISTLEMRFNTADTVIYLDFPRITCFWRLFKRMLSKSDHNADTGCLHGINWSLIRYTWNFNRDKKAIIKSLHEKYPGVNFLEFHHPKNIQEYLARFQHGS